MPFYYVQSLHMDDMMALLTIISQIIPLKSMNLLDHVGMEVTLDIGEDKIIHPAEKIKLGERQSRTRAKLQHKRNSISWPVYKYHQVDWDK